MRCEAWIPEKAADTGKGSHNPDAPGVEEMLRGAFVIED